MVTVTHPTEYDPQRLLDTAKEMEKAIEQAKLPNKEEEAKEESEETAEYESDLDLINEAQFEGFFDEFPEAKSFILA